MSFQKHDLIQDGSRLLLVLGILRDDTGRPEQIAIADCTNRSWPDIVAAEDATAKTESGAWVLLGPDKKEGHFLAQGHIRSLDEIAGKNQRVRFERIKQRNFTLIQPVLAQGWSAFDAVERRIAIEDVVHKLPKARRVTARWIGSLLLRYWLSGCNPLALGPQNYRAGATRRSVKLEKMNNTAAASSSTVVTEGLALTLRANPLVPALKTVERFANEYIEHPLNQSVISVSRRRNGGLPWKKITQHVNHELKKIPAFCDLRLTRRQVSYLMQPLIEMEKVIRRTKGHRHANTNHRLSNGDVRDIATHAGARFEFDGVNADLFVTDEFTGAVIARLQLYLVVDVFSGMVVGIYGALGGLKKHDAPRVLHSAFAPKGPLLKALGLDIPPEEWPCEGIPESIGADNAELKTAAAECLPELVDVGLARPYRGDDKGVVEKTSDLLQSQHLIKYGPGYTEGPKKRAAENPADKAYVSVKPVLRELVRYIVLTHNHRPLPKEHPIPDEFLKTGRTATPINMYRWSVGRKGGALAAYDPNTMMPRLLPSEEATITDKGIRVDSLDLYYDLPTEMDHLRVAATCGGPSRKARVFYDPLFLTMVYLADSDRRKPLIKCALAHVSRDHAERTFREMELRNEYVKTLHALATGEFEQRDNLTNEAQRATAIESAKKLKKRFGSLRRRNAVSKQIDEETVIEVQNKSLAEATAKFFPSGSNDEGAAPPDDSRNSPLPVDAGSPSSESSEDPATATQPSEPSCFQ